ncbi:ribonuclease HI [Geitlerinema sp. PCC 7407]|uniref:ribonuclease HI n=1 Tax=Geitlerinema sp. PCC 7407 TaxID=1173025 RepID=UPI00029F8E0C|nr:ribonuclease HI [Geitlerinema sp. PCC 7407]AFY68224.1 Ribonuclease H [Geitlerinema sp. PCC 7407]
MGALITTIYTDGACSGNPGPGGWGVVVNFADGTVQELGGHEAQTTNNRMEMQAAIAALEFLRDRPQSEPIALHTDSEYVKKGVTQWLAGWKRKGWKTSTGSAVLNQDLWETLDRLNSSKVSWHYVRGHAGNKDNERCDAIARVFAQGKAPNLRQSSEIAPRSSVATDRKNDNSVESISNLAAPPIIETPMVESTAATNQDSLDSVPREVRVTQLRNLVETLHMADEIAKQGYLISSSELADLMDVNASAVTSRGDNWVWRNWVVSRVRREGNQILWQLERVD